jgi:hypothetical protein
LFCGEGVVFNARFHGVLTAETDVAKHSQVPLVPRWYVVVSENSNKKTTIIGNKQDDQRRQCTQKKKKKEQGKLVWKAGVRLKGQQDPRKKKTSPEGEKKKS